jgi:hypothetical protein
MHGSRKAELYSMSRGRYVAELTMEVEAETSSELFRNATEPKYRTVKSKAFPTSHSECDGRRNRCTARRTPFLQTLVGSLSASERSRHSTDVAFLWARDKPSLRVVPSVCFLG